MEPSSIQNLGRFLWLSMNIPSEAPLSPRVVEGSSRAPGESQDKEKETQDGFQIPGGTPSYSKPSWVFSLGPGFPMGPWSFFRTTLR